MKKVLVRHQMLANGEEPKHWFYREDRYKAPQLGAGYFGPRVYLKNINRKFGTALKTAMWLKPRGEVVFNIQGQNLRAFSAWVGVPQETDKDAVMNYEIYVDGVLRTQSNLMTIDDRPRLLVVRGLDKAKELMLVNRMADMHDNLRTCGFWGDPQFYRKE
jgi:hypothetical protein